MNEKPSRYHGRLPPSSSANTTSRLPVLATFPLSPRRNERIGGVLLERRLVRCERRRQQLPNLAAVDFYERSGNARRP
jgi:hypothetical protein